MGQRLFNILEEQEHGKGRGAFSVFIGKSISSIQGYCKSKTLDIVVIEQACEFYEMSLSEFLGLPHENLPEVFKIKSGKELNTLEKRVSRIDKNVSLILEKLNKVQ